MPSSKRTSRRRATKVIPTFRKEKQAAHGQELIKDKSQTTVAKGPDLPDDKLDSGCDQRTAKQGQVRSKQTHQKSNQKSSSKGFIPTTDNPGKSPVGHASSKKHLSHHEVEKNSVTIFKKSRIHDGPEKLRETGYDVEILEQLPEQPGWFPEYIQEIFSSPRCPENVSLTVSITFSVVTVSWCVANQGQALLQLSEYRSFLSKEEHKRWKTYVKAGRLRLWYELHLEQYVQHSAPLPLVLDCRRKLKYHKKAAINAMWNLDVVARGIKYFDTIMSDVYKLEREMYKKHLPTS